MKRGSKALIAVTIALVFWLILALIFYLWSDDTYWRDDGWYYEFMTLAQLSFLILTPIMLMAVALAILSDDKREEPKMNFVDTRPVESRPAPRYEVFEEEYERPAPAPRPQPRAQPRAQPRTQSRQQPAPQPRPRPQQRAQPRAQQRARPRAQPRPRPQPQARTFYDGIPDYEPSIFDDEIQCPACNKWITTDMPSCAFCKTKVANFNRVRQVKAQYNQGNITRDQYNKAMKNLKG